MKRKVYVTIAMMILVGAIGFSARAQTSSQQQWSASVPFAFSAGQTVLPAGEYTVRIVNPASDQTVLQIRSEDGQLSATVRTMAGTGQLSDDAALTFRRYGDKYFFAELSLAGERTRLIASKSNYEKATQRELARTQTSKQSEIVAIKAR